MKYIVGVDVGGTNVVVGTLPADGSTIHGLVTESTMLDRGPEGTIEQIAHLIAKSLEQSRAAMGKEIDVVGVGIGSPGPLDPKTGVVLVTPNLGWTNMPLRDRVSEAVGLPATLENDANCAMLGDWWRGAAQGGRLVIGLTIGTGVGGGIVHEGKIFSGASGLAGEIGHASIDSDGRRCKCGNYGCLEAYASGPAIASRAREGIDAGVSSSLASYANGKLDEMTAETVSRAANDGDPFALDIIRDTARFLGGAAANMMNILNPDYFVVCGGVTEAGDHLFEPMRWEVRRRAFRPVAQSCQIVPGSLIGTAGVYGAVAAFKNRTGENA